MMFWYFLFTSLMMYLSYKVGRETRAADRRYVERIEDECRTMSQIIEHCLPNDKAEQAIGGNALEYWKKQREIHETWR
jgi:hypothetical protein